MKIPETSANVGAYYGNENNGQWQQANGVVIDSGVGGGVVGSGDAGLRPPVYPVHVPRHVPGGYVMAGGYYPGAPAFVEPQDDFEDYMWMENEEEFDKQVMQQLEEEALMEQCIEAMLEDEQREQRQRPVSNGHNHYPTTSNGSTSLSLEETVSRSKLNPLAAEFVPFRARPPPEEKQDVTETSKEVESAKEVTPPAEIVERTDEVDSKPSVEESKTEEPAPVASEPPEVSAADVQPIDKEKKPKEVKKDTKPKPEVKKVVKNEKNEVKKPKPAPVKSDSKVVAKRKEVKPKSEAKEEVATEIVKQSTPPPVEETQPGIKPINYAAAAKANKPKKATSPVAEKPPAPVKTEVKPPKPTEKIEKKAPVKEKVKPEKIDKPVAVQRKNSTK